MPRKWKHRLHSDWSLVHDRYHCCSVEEEFKNFEYEHVVSNAFEVKKCMLYNWFIVFLPLWDYLKMQEKQDVLLYFPFYLNTGVHWIVRLSETHTCAKSETKSNNNGPLSVEFLSLLVPIWAKTWKKMLTKLCQTTSILACGLDKSWGHFSLYPERALFTVSLLRLKGDREKAKEKSLKMPKCIAEPWKNTTY